MKKVDIAIIGASAAGLSAAITIKNKAPEKSVLLFRKVKKTPVPCGIPYIFGTLKDVKKNLIPDEHFKSMGLEIIVAEVKDIDTKNKKIFYNGEEIFYDKLLLATGSYPFIPPIEGINLKNVFAIEKNPEDLEIIDNTLKDISNLVIIGGGFIGVEVAEQIAKLKGDKINITIIEMMPHILMAALEKEFCIKAEEELRSIGVNILTNSTVTKLEGKDKVEKVILKDGKWIRADMVIIGVGAAPNIELAEKIGINCDRRAGILVNEYMETNISDIYAAGDCASKFSFITKKPTGIRLASVAAYEGIVAANNIIGNKIENKGAVGAFSTKIGKFAIGSAGFTKHACENEGIDYITGEFTGPDKHPATLPNTFKDMKAILIFRKDNGKIIGGHILGGETTGEMINIISTSIQAGLTAKDLYFMQVATHPLLTGSPIAYHIQRAAGDAYFKMK